MAHKPKKGRRVVQWAEVYANVGTKLDKSAIVHIWRSAHIARHPAFNRYIDPAQVVADGYQTLVNIGYDSTTWYLDNIHNNWTSFYRKEPCLGISDADCAQYVLGGEGQMWGESVDASDLDQTVWSVPTTFETLFPTYTSYCWLVFFFSPFHKMILMCVCVCVCVCVCLPWRGPWWSATSRIFP